MILRIFAPFLLLSFSFCAHHPDVMPGASGLHKITLKAATKADARRAATAQGHSYCKSKKKTPGFTKEEFSYSGELKEEDYQKVQKTVGIAKSVGSAILGPGSDRGAVHRGGKAAQDALGYPYTINAEFRCL